MVNFQKKENVWKKPKKEMSKEIKTFRQKKSGQLFMIFKYTQHTPEKAFRDPDQHIITRLSSLKKKTC